jgi:glycosyltransferase involved in cell wall biosynthesis
MKIAIYTIARNEFLEVAGREHATREADYRLLFDTGSTDGTPEAMEKLPGVTVVRGSIKPWRFDDARNTALSLLPADIDICIALDMDERLRGKGCPSGTGWRELILANWDHDSTMLRCAMNSGGVVYYSSRIHSRYNYRWKNPIHETLYWRGEGSEVAQLTDAVIIDHLPIPHKPRPAERGLLEEAVRESPEDARMRLQFGWHLVLRGEKQRGIAELRRYLDLSFKNGLDAAFVHRLIAENDDPANFLIHLQRAEDAHPSASNSVLLVDHYRGKGMWQECLDACQEALARERMRLGLSHWGDHDLLRRVCGDGMTFCGADQDLPVPPRSWLTATASHAHLMVLRPMWTTSPVT